MRQPEQIEHKGVVRSIDEGVVRVDIEVNEACGSCASRKACAMGQGTTREVVVCTDDAERYSVGEVVNVLARQSAGIMAVVLCYVVPLVVLLVAIVAMQMLGFSDGVSAIVGLGVQALYFGVLALFRNKISKKIVFTINKI